MSVHIGKAAAAILDDGVDEQYHSYVPEEKCGAVKRKGGECATHLLRTVLDYAASWGRSVAILFVDLVKAFDRVLREIVIGHKTAAQLESSICASWVSLRSMPKHSNR